MPEERAEEDCEGVRKGLYVGDNTIDSERLVSYRILFMGSCALISILAGGYWSYYSAQQSAVNADMHDNNRLQWDAIRTVSDQVRETAIRQSNDHETIIDLSLRLREAEAHAAIMDSKRR